MCVYRYVFEKERQEDRHQETEEKKKTKNFCLNNFFPIYAA